MGSLSKNSRFLMRSIFCALSVMIHFPVFGTTYTLSPGAQKISWRARKVTGEHWGTVNVASGSIESSQGQVLKAKLVFDMKSIEVSDMQNENYLRIKLQTHLEEADFFNVAQFPTSSFELKSAFPKGAQVSAAGILEVLGIKKDIQVSLLAKEEAGYLQLKGQAKVDRTQFGIKYGSANFFSDLGDRMIDNEFSITFDWKLAEATEASKAKKKKSAAK